MTPIERIDKLKSELEQMGVVLKAKDELLRTADEVERGMLKLSALSKKIQAVKERLHCASTGPEQAAALRDLAKLVERKDALEKDVVPLQRKAWRQLKDFERLAKALTGAQAASAEATLADLLKQLSKTQNTQN